MSGLYIVALPDWAGGAEAIVEGWRARHDPEMAARIGAHVTLVFGQPLASQKLWVDRLHATCATHPPVEITCRRVVPGTDHSGPGGYGFLVPDEGNSALHRLRDRLHAGALPEGLRPEIPFTPHITVARCASPAAALPICDALNAQPRALHARIARLNLVELDGSGTLTSLTQGTLHGPHAP